MRHLIKVLPLIARALAHKGDSSLLSCLSTAQLREPKHPLFNQSSLGLSRRSLKNRHLRAQAKNPFLICPPP